MTVRVEVADITTSQVDAIVNAANSSLLPGGGVCGAIHAVGGPAIAEECARIMADLPQGVRPGEAVATTGGALAARHVIHAVGPIYHQDPDPDATLAQVYRSCLRVAAEVGARSVAFPAISTGIYGFPSDRAAPIVQRTLEQELAAMADPPEVHLVFFSDGERAAFEANAAG